MPYSPNVACSTPTPRCCRRPPPPGRRGTSRPRPAGRPATGGVTVTYDLTRLQRLATDTHYLVTLGGEDLVDPATVIDRMEYEHPLYTPPRSPPSAGCPISEHRPARLRRGLPRLGLPRGRCALGAGGGGAPGLDWPRFPWPRRWLAAGTGASPASTGPRSGTPGAGRSARTVHAPLAHLAGRPRRPARPRGARPVRGARPPRRPGPVDPRATSRRSSPGNGVDLRGGRILMARTPGVRLLLQPDQRVLVPRRRRAARSPWSSRCTTPTATGTPTSSIPTSSGRAAHRQGDVRLAVPRHRRHLRRWPCRCPVTACTSRSPCAATTARSSAHRSPAPARRDVPAPRRRWRAAPAALRGSCSSASTASGCGPVGCRCDPGRPTTRKA